MGISTASPPALSHPGIHLQAEHPFLMPESAQDVQEDSGVWPILLVQPSVNRPPTSIKCAGTSLLTSRKFDLN